MQFETANGVLIARNYMKYFCIEPWGKNFFVRATMLPELSNQDQHLQKHQKAHMLRLRVSRVDHWVGDGTIDKRESASITNGRICAVVNFVGVIVILP